MKALSLWQPWASAIAVGAKHIETRGRLTHHRGPLAIHATANSPRGELLKRMHEMDAVSVSLFLAAGIRDDADLPHGAIVATCELVDCVPITQAFVNRLSRTEYPWGHYSEGRFAWVLEKIKRVASPIPRRGGQFLWDWDEVPF